MVLMVSSTSGLVCFSPCQSKLMVTKGRALAGGDKLGAGMDVHTTIHKIDNQGPSVQHRELCSRVYDKLWGKRI